MPNAAATQPVYDTFISYRHQNPDRAFARKILALLESKGLKVAVDERDFAPNKRFLTEMERCIKQSRFTLAILSPRYLDSEFCLEEAVIRKVGDMGESKRRLVPLIIEKVEMPIWLYGIAGIDFTADDPLVDPCLRLLNLFGVASSSAGVPATRAVFSPPVAREPAAPGRTLPALSIWKEKLEFFLAEEAKASDPDMKFNLRKRIEEVKQKIRELEGGA